MEHTCHRPGCNTPCPPKWLMCREHWNMVDAKTQRMVYATVAKRGNTVDHTWAPWWRWAHRAIAQALPDNERRTKWLAKHERTADQLAQNPTS